MRCTSCRREGAYIRVKTKEVVCRNCGKVEPLNKQKKVDKKGGV